ncbi:MAG: nickel pincer cofactor biosynthesis protein LarB [Pirellulaceae bacterium]|nr:nickel pincer cofactor biosynthesis protein LarB [Pirellulaceae bacterium]
MHLDSASRSRLVRPDYSFFSRLMLMSDHPPFAQSDADPTDWLDQARTGQLSWTQVAERLLRLEHPSGREHQPDVDRLRRCGFGEVIFGENKSARSIITIAARLLDSSQDEVLVTRCHLLDVPAIVAGFKHARFDCLGRTLRLSHRLIDDTILAPHEAATAQVCVVTAGSTDLPIAREALETLAWMRVPCRLLSDVGVAGPYRLLPHLDNLRTCRAIVVCAGMEGALASVLGGLVPCPVIAVPTSIGYGANLAGITTLLSMMSSCAAGVSVVNIDAGFKGGYVAGLIAASHPQASPTNHSC